MTAISPFAASITPSSVTNLTSALLRHDQHFAVGIVEKAIAHRCIGGVDMHGHAGQIGRAAVSAEVTRPAMKSVGAAGIGNGLQRNCDGVASVSANGAVRSRPLSIRL